MTFDAMDEFTGKEIAGRDDQDSAPALLYEFHGITRDMKKPMRKRHAAREIRRCFDVREVRVLVV